MSTKPITFSKIEQNGLIHWDQNSICYIFEVNTRTKKHDLSNLLQKLSFPLSFIIKHCNGHVDMMRKKLENEIRKNVKSKNDKKTLKDLPNFLNFLDEKYLANAVPITKKYVSVTVHEPNSKHEYLHKLLTSQAEELQSLLSKSGYTAKLLESRSVQRLLESFDDAYTLFVNQEFIHIKDIMQRYESRNQRPQQESGLIKQIKKLATNKPISLSKVSKLTKSEAEFKKVMQEVIKDPELRIHNHNLIKYSSGKNAMLAEYLDQTKTTQSLNYLERGSQIVSGYEITGYPKQTSGGLFSGLLRENQDSTIKISITPYSTMRAIRIMEQKQERTETEYSHKIGKGIFDSNLEAMNTQYAKRIGEMKYGKYKFFNIKTHIVTSSPSENVHMRTRNRLENTLSARSLKLTPTIKHHDKVLQNIFISETDTVNPNITTHKNLATIPLFEK